MTRFLTAGYVCVNNMVIWYLFIESTDGLCTF